MRPIKRILETVSETRDNLLMNKRIILNFNNKRDVWNSKRRFSY
ncbi:MAG: hypothetical protein NXH73_12560 [Flavobacteriaceae bacterium]|nr:hypothetical protein [Flavobacteriaceae bacterium]